ncbi:MAG: DUF1295 domain-containing protein [Bacilli bacterium]|nr:DUF1295 domain-containing protein [Bacilli bacterium]
MPLLNSVSSMDVHAFYWLLIGIFTAVSALCCSMGYKRFVWFLSIGYGTAVVGLGIAYAVTGFVIGHWDIIMIIQCILFVIYGGRLAGFLLIRELKNAGYKKVLKEEIKTNDTPIPFFVKFTVWILVAILYVMQTSPVLDRIANGNVWWPTNPEGGWVTYVLPIIGIVISILGIILEALADKQKSEQKKINPHMVATKGLYKRLRCPNYFGEIVFWTGVFVGGLTCMNAWYQWVLASIGYVCIVYIMINGAQRLDKRQEKNYGSNPDYRAYADHTPLIFPLLPIYHIGDYKGERDAEKAAKKAAKKAKKEGK